MADLEPYIRASLGDIALRLAAMPLSAPERSKVFESVMVEMANAAGVPMHGWTAYDPAIAAPPEVASIATALGTAATPHRNRYDITPFSKPSLGASGTVIYTDAATGEQSTLLVRTRKRPEEWTYPAGYMDILPHAPVMYSDRVDMKTRDTLEERTLDASAMPGDVAALPQQGGNLTGEAFAPFEKAKPVLDAHYKELLKDKGWEEADRLMHDERHVIGVLVQNGVMLPQLHGFDFDAEGCYKRELKEEGGLDLAKYPEAKTVQVKFDLTYGYSSGNGQAFTANPHFLTDLGTQASAPPLSPHESDIVEAEWVKLKDIAPDGAGNYIIPGEKPLKLDAYDVPVLERALHTYMDQRIAEVSGGQYESARGVELAYNLPASGSTTLAGADGQNYMHAAIHAAQALTQSPLPALSRILSVAANGNGQDQARH